MAHFQAIEAALHRVLVDDRMWVALGDRVWLDHSNILLQAYEEVQDDQDVYHQYASAVARRYSWLMNLYKKYDDGSEPAPPMS